MACVALTSLMATLELEFVQSIHPELRVFLDDEDESKVMCCLLKRLKQSVSNYGRVEMLLKRLCSLQALLEKEKCNGSPEFKDLEIKITDFALKAEDHIETQLSNFLLAKDEEHRKTASQDLHQTLREAAKNAAELLEIRLPTVQAMKPQFSGLPKNNGNEMVGRHRDRRVINDLVFDDYDGLRIISIVGMMGIGKTALAASIYTDPSVTSHFQIRIWITLPQEYHDVNQTLRHLLWSITQVDSDATKDRWELVSDIRDCLRGRRYLIVLDNLWDNSAGEYIFDCFPSKSEGRVLVTTMHFDQKCYANTNYYYKHNMTFLDPKESWDLFCNILSVEEPMAHKFEKIRSQVVEKCEGLPQVIVDVAERLSKCNNIRQEWKKIEKELELVGALDRSAYTIRYNQLPQYLKVCFLYFGVFPKRSEIPVKMLIRLWIAEGFVKPLEHNKVLENVAYDYLQELADRSLVLISKWSSDGKIKTCKMHGLMHAFCVGEAQKGGILCAVNILQLPGVSLNAFANSCRWLSFYPHGFDYYVLFNTNNSHSIFFFRENPEMFVPLKLLRLLDFVPPPFFQRMQMHLGDLIFLRYLSVTRWFEGLDYIVSINHYLQTLIVSGNESQLGASTVHLPSRIWESPQLRHLELGNSYTVDPPSVDKKNFQTLSWASPTCCQKNVYNMFPKLKKVKIFIKDDLEPYCTGSCSNPIILDNLDYLVRLEKLSISVSIGCSVTLQNQSMFPFLLEKLRLSGLNLSERHLMLIGMLPRLKVLKLENAFHGKVWGVAEGGFRQLGFLLLEAKNLEQLKANKYSFPYIQRLCLRFCYCLEEIPKSFAEIYKLNAIELEQCRPSVVAAAKQIREGLHPLRRRLFEIKIDGLEYEDPHVEDDLAEITVS